MRSTSGDAYFQSQIYFSLQLVCLRGRLEAFRHQNTSIVHDQSSKPFGYHPPPAEHRRQSQLPGPAQDSGAGGGQQRSDKKRPRPSSATSTDGAEGGGSLADGSCLRDPLTAWFYDCYNHDDYRGHVSDLHKFLAGIDVSHVCRCAPRPFCSYFFRSLLRLRVSQQNRYCVTAVDFGAEAGCYGTYIFGPRIVHSWDV